MDLKLSRRFIIQIKNLSRGHNLLVSTKSLKKRHKQGNFNVSSRILNSINRQEAKPN